MTMVTTTTMAGAEAMSAFRSAALVASAGAGALGWGLHEAARVFRVRRHVVPILPAGSDDLRVLHVSDLHLLPRQRERVAFTRGLADLEPDLVVSTGDSMASRGGLETALEALDPLLSLPGVFVFGSNDYFGPTPKNPFTYFSSPTSGSGPSEPEHLPADDLARAFTSRGWLDLDNARGRLTVRGLDVTFVGVDDPHRDYDEFPADDGARGVLHIGVTHAPYARILDEFLLDGCHLAFAGHTHGGQVCVPGYGALVTNCDMPRWRASGLQAWPGLRPDGVAVSPQRPFAPIPREDRVQHGPTMWLNISAGLGTSPYAPVRFACPPEVSLLTLTSR